MNIISSRQTFFYKKVFPVIWFGIILLILAMNVFPAFAYKAGDTVIILIVPVLMLIIGFLLFRKLVWNLADEVQDAGSYLLVRRGSVEQHVPLTNIVNVSMSQFTNPRRLTLRLRTPSEFGDEIAFIPRMPFFRFNPFARNPVAEDLIRRLDHARQEARA